MCSEGRGRKGPWEFPEPKMEKYPGWVRVTVIIGGTAFAWAAIIGLYLAFT